LFVHYLDANINYSYNNNNNTHLTAHCPGLHG